MNSDDEKKGNDERKRDEKLDALDLIIGTLREHEHALDDIVQRLENILDRTPPGQSVPSVEMKDWEEFASRCSEAPLVSYEETKTTFWVDTIKLGLKYSYREDLPLMRVRTKRVGESSITEVLFSSSPDNVYPMVITTLHCGLKGRIESTRVEAEAGVYVNDTRLRLSDEDVRPWLAGQLGIDVKNVMKGRLAT